MRRIQFRLPLRSSVFFLPLFIFLFALFQASLAFDSANTQSILILFLSNGDKVSGTVVSVTVDQVEVETKYAGRVRITISEIKAWQSSDLALRSRLTGYFPIKDNDTLVKDAAAAKEKAKLVSAKTPTTKSDAKLAKTDPWKRQLNFAYTMTRGNIRSSDMNVAFNTSRKRGSRKVSLTSYGRYGVNNGKESANLISNTFRYERTANKLPVFTETQFEIDKLKKLDYRLSENIGFSYPVLKGDSQQLAFDFGTGVTKEDYETGLQKLNATSLLRFKASQKLTEKTLLNQQATFFSDLTDPGAYRIQAEASFTTPITKHLALRLAGINRFDARPQGQVKPNDFTLLTGFTFDF